MGSDSFTFTLTPAQGARLREILEQGGFEMLQPPHTHFGAKKGKCSVSWFTSGKLLVQGKEARDFVEFTLEPLVLLEARLGYEAVHDPGMFEPHFGVDEAGKGDFFGPLVIAGAFVDRNLVNELSNLGVRDSKRITSDVKVRKMAEEIRRLLGARCKVIVIGPARYNELLARLKSVNRLLSWGHARVIDKLAARIPDCPRAVSDQFGDPAWIRKHLKDRGIQVELESRTRAESDPAVAAASVLARAAFLEKLEALGNSLGVTLAKGAGAAVDAQAADLARSHGEEVFGRIAKTHFRTLKKALGQPLPAKPDPAVFRRRGKAS